jgi:hypothetical protein
VEHFGHGNRSAYLRATLPVMESLARAERLRELQARNASADCLGVVNNAAEFALWLSPHILANTGRVLAAVLKAPDEEVDDYLQALADSHEHVALAGPADSRAVAVRADGGRLPPGTQTATVRTAGRCGHTEDRTLRTGVWGQEGPWRCGEA